MSARQFLIEARGSLWPPHITICIWIPGPALKAEASRGPAGGRELICYAADKSREQFYRDMPLYASGELEKRVEALVQRRLEGEPVAYIVGEWNFYGPAPGCVQ